MADYEGINKTIKKEKDHLISMAKEIHRNPETGRNEFIAANLITQYLEKKGFKVFRGVGGLKTSFMASKGDEGYHVGFCAEYDALPEIGHGCGHNLIAISSVAAGVALASAIDGQPGRVSIIGTPDEEEHGGKVDLVRLGVFDDIDAAMMFHPDCATRIHNDSLACRDYKFIFYGKNAHASSEPWEGRNALDAVIQTFNNISALRQHLKDNTRIHGIITEGGLAVNVIPDRTAANFLIRASNSEYLKEVVEKVINCARSAAIATGTDLEVSESDYPYEAMLSNKKLGDTFAASLDEAGYSVISKNDVGIGSIDMGNVSRVTPAIYPVLALTNEWVPRHTSEFATLCDTDRAYEVMLTAAKAMAITGLKAIKDQELQNQIKKDFESQ
ncbi:MAG: M20 family metallopeptidase [Bacillota bacterium]